MPVGTLVNAITALMPAAGRPRLSATGTALMVAMALLALAKYLRGKQPGLVHSHPAGAAPPLKLPQLADLVVALVAAARAGLALELCLRIDDDGSLLPVVTNLVTDRDLALIGHTSAADALGREVLALRRDGRARSLLQRVAPGLHSLSGAPADNEVAAMVKLYHDDKKLTPIVVLGPHEAGLAAHAAQAWAVVPVLRGDDGSFDAAAQAQWAQSSRIVLNYLQPALGLLGGAVPAAAVAPAATRPAPTPAANLPLVFISYAHEDRGLLDELLSYLKQFVRAGRITVWTDYEIPGGHPWREKIEEGMAKCQLAVMLLTHHFMGSDFIGEVEQPRLERRADLGEIDLIPVLMSDCEYGLSPWLGARQVVPPPDTPLPDSSQGGLRTRALNGIARGIFKRAQARAARKRPSHPAPRQPP